MQYLVSFFHFCNHLAEEERECWLLCFNYILAVVWLLVF